MIARNPNLVLTLSLLLVVGAACRCDRSGDATDVVSDAGPAAVEPDSAAAKAKRLRPAFDADGIPIPDSQQALGVAVPRGFERIAQEKGTVIYSGLVPAEKVVAFYRKYLDCPFVTEVSRGWRFEEATPRPPGDPSRSVDLTVLKRGGRRAEVVVIDRLSRAKVPPAPDGGPATYEELFQSAHKGAASSKRPIPGTY